MEKKISTGLIVGFISGFFSTGGGLLLYPILTHIFKLEDKKARATTLFIILPMAIVSSFIYTKNAYIDWKIAINCAIGGIIGGIIGTKLSKSINKNYLKITFIIFLMYSSYRMIFK